MTYKIHAVIPLLALALLIPSGALAGQTNELGTGGIVDNPHLISPNDATGPVGRADDLQVAHGTLTDIMQQQALGSFETPDYPFLMTMVDEEKGDLVVVMHVMAAAAGIEYDEEEIAIALDTDVPIDVQYGISILEVSKSRIESWKQYYGDNCIPVKPGYQTVCKLFGDNLKKNGIDLSKLKPSTTTTKPTPKKTSPCDKDNDSLACYYYKKYQERCIPTKTTSRCDTYATQIKNAGYDVPTSKSTVTKVPPPMVVNVTAAISGDTIRVSWNTPQYPVDKYRVYVYEDDTRTDREYIQTNSYTLNDTKKGKDYQFRVYVYYKNNDKLTSTYGGYASSNVVSVPDANAPATTKPNPKPKPVTIVPEASATRELRGGDMIRAFGNNPLQLEGTSGTAGLIINYTGHSALLTSSHLIKATSLYRVVSLDSSTGSGLLLPEIGTAVLANSNISVNKTSRSDSALIKITGKDISPVLNEITTKNGTLDVISFGGVRNMTAGDVVEISARHSNGTGHIQYTNVTASLTIEGFGDYIVTNQASATYPSKPGDSGGPIFVNHSNGTATMLGIVVGGTCIIDADGAKLDLRDPYGACRHAFKLFSQWENIAEDLKIP